MNTYKELMKQVKMLEVQIDTLRSMIVDGNVMRFSPSQKRMLSISINEIEAASLWLKKLAEDCLD